jgi:3-phytase
VSPIHSVAATVETHPVPSAEDAADDPALWIDPTDASRSTIIGTDKLGGIAVYDLAGNQIQYLTDGKMNNVDIRTSFPLGGQSVALVAASNRSDDTIALYRMNPSTRMLEDVAARRVKTVTAYGCCMYRSAKTKNSITSSTTSSDVCSSGDYSTTAKAK